MLLSQQNLILKLNQYSSKLLFSSNGAFCTTRRVQNTLNTKFFRQNHSNAGTNTLSKIVHKQGGHFRSVLSRPTLNKLLFNCKSVQEQIEVFQSYVCLTDDDYTARQSICKNIEEIFKSVFPYSSMCLIGSSVTGLGLRGCDVDLSFQFSNKDTDQVCASQILVISNVDVASGNFPLSEFPLLPNKQQLIFLQKILNESGLIENSTTIPGRYPILNFTCNNLACDLSINNRFGFLATSLIQYCCKSDSRVAPICQLITYWGRQLKLIGGVLKFKSYAVFLMVVYFLQTRHPVIIPPLQDMVQEEEFLECIHRCSDTTKYAGKIHQSNNTESLGNLLRDFFFFYANFDFSSVICPLDVKLIKRESMILENPEFELNTVSIQDPLNRSLNVTTSVCWRHCKSFMKSLLSACDTFHENPQQPITEQNWGLLALLDYTSLDYSFVEKEVVEMELALSNNYSNDVRIETLNNGIDKVFKVFKDCLLFQCDIYYPDNEVLKFSKIESLNRTRTFEKLRKQKRNNKSNENKSIDGNSEKVVVSRSIYVTSSDAWLGRSNYVSHCVEQENEFLKQEREISKKILQNRTKDEKNEFIFLCECSGIYTNCGSYLKLTMKPLNRNLFIPKLGIFLKEYLYKYAIKYL